MQNDFKIDTFTPKHLKKSQIVLDKHLKVMEKHQETIETYKKELFHETGFWNTIKHVLHLD